MKRILTIAVLGLALSMTLTMPSVLTGSGAAYACDGDGGD